MLVGSLVKVEDINTFLFFIFTSDPSMRLTNTIVFGILSYLQFHDPAKATLKSGITSGFAGLNGTNLESIAWNIIHQQVSNHSNSVLFTPYNSQSRLISSFFSSAL